MQNVSLKMSNSGILTILIDTNLPGTPSASQKTIVIASTRGNADVGDTAHGKLKLGLNLFLKPNTSA